MYKYKKAAFISSWNCKESGGGWGKHNVYSKMWVFFKPVAFVFYGQQYQ